MDWREKLAVMKLDGFTLRQTNGWNDDPKTHWRYVCEVDDDNVIYGTGDTKAQAVNTAWRKYVEFKNEKAS
jgi:hypothetical protein